MTIAEFRAACDALSRYATKAEKTDKKGSKDTKSHKHRFSPISWEAGFDGKPDYNRPLMMACSNGRCTVTPRADEVGEGFDPTDRVFIQASKGEMKFVAGTAESTIIVSVGYSDQQGFALVPARLLLVAADTLRGKGDVVIELTPDGAVLRTSAGGRVILPNVDTKVPPYIRPEEPSYRDRVCLPAKFWPEALKALESSVDKFWPFNHIEVATSGEEYLVLAASTLNTMVEGVFSDDVEPHTFDTEGAVGGIPVDFVKGLRPVKGPSELSWGPNTLTVRSGSITATTRLRKTHPGFPHRDMFDEARPVVVKMPAKTLADTVSLAYDTHADSTVVRLDVAQGTLRVGLSTIPVVTEGEGGIFVDAKLLHGLAKAWPGHSVKLSFAPDSRAPITLEGDAPWTMRLAPVAL